MSKPLPLSDQIRRAAKRHAGTRADLARKAGLSESELSRFLSGERGLGLPDLDSLAATLGLRLTTSTTTRRNK